MSSEYRKVSDVSRRNLGELKSQAILLALDLVVLGEGCIGVVRGSA
jgi:hypothetical protein